MADLNLRGTVNPVQTFSGSLYAVPGETGGGTAGKDGGYYTPSVTQPDDNTMRVAFTPSDNSMPEIESKDVTLPAGKDATVDATLTQSGQAADAKATGDAIHSLSKEMLTEESDPTVPAWAKEAQKPSYTASEVGADPSGTASAQVAAHNSGTDTHSDIRVLIQGLTDRLNALADSDDTTLDQLSEVVAYIKSNRDLISSITTSKVSVSDIVNNLTTNVANKPLSAAQGVALKALIDAISVPDKLPNPNALTFTGAVTGSYDGSEPLTVNIPSSGGGSGGSDALTAGYTLIMAETLAESSAISITDDGTYNEILIFIVCPSGEAISFSKFTGVLGWGNRLNNTNIALASGNKRGFWGHFFRVQRDNDKSVVAGEYAAITLTNSTTNVFNVETNIQILHPVTSDAEMSGVLFSSTVALPAGSVIQILGR